MSINMLNVKKIEMPSPVILYKNTFSFSNSNVRYKGTSTPCPIKVTLYSTTTPAWTGATSTSSDEIYYYLGTLGYSFSVAAGSARCYMIVDNPYEFEYWNGSVGCAFTSCTVRSRATSSSYFLPYFIAPGSTSAVTPGIFTISQTGWTEVGSVNSFSYYTKTYNTLSGGYTMLLISQDLNGQEYIANYVKATTSYPDVTIASVSGNTYTLSDGTTCTPTQYLAKSFGGIKEVRKIENLNGDILWQPRELTSITVSGMTQDFDVNDTYVFGGTVTAHYLNGATEDVTASTTFTGYDMSTHGTQTVTATYTEDGITQTTTYTINVYTTSTTTVNVPITTIATFAATSSNYYIKPNAAYRSQATNYIATQLGITTARIKTQVWGNMRIDFYQYNTYSSTQRTYVLLSTSTSSSSAMSNYIYSGNCRSTSTHRQPADLTYNGSTDIPSLSNVNYWIWLAVNQSSTPSTYYRTSSSTPSTYVRVDDTTVSNSYIPVTVTYQSL